LSSLLLHLNAMVVAILVYDHAQLNEGAFHPRSPIQVYCIWNKMVSDCMYQTLAMFPLLICLIRVNSSQIHRCCETLCDQPAELQPQLHAARSAIIFASKHFQDDSTPEQIRQMLSRTEWSTRLL
jgi:hypothetical protein